MHGDPPRQRRRNAYRIFVGNPEGKRRLITHRHRWDRSDLREIESTGIDWFHLAQDRDQFRALVDTIMSLQMP
jgi:hypothetical protein